MDACNVASKDRSLDVDTNGNVYGREKSANEALDALNKAIGEADAFLEKYPRYEKASVLRSVLVDTRDKVEASSNPSTGETQAIGSTTTTLPETGN